jgi:hypothetical protein
MIRKEYQGSSETLRNASHLFNETESGKPHFASTFKNSSISVLEDDLFHNWLAGLIDADGGFYVSKAGYVSCEITMHTSEVQTLYYIKEKCGGKVHPRTQSKSFRWRLHNRANLENLCNALNGKLRTFSKLEQWKKVCEALRIELIPCTSGLTADNAWLSGFFCGDGHFHINSVNFKPSLGIGQRDSQILREISSIWGGSVYYDKSWDGWIWWVGRMAQLKLITTYLNIYPLQNPSKIARLKGFERYLRYLEREDHLKPALQSRLRKYIRFFKSRDEDKVQKAS